MTVWQISHPLLSFRLSILPGERTEASICAESISSVEETQDLSVSAFDSKICTTPKTPL